MTGRTLKIKEWFFDKTSEKASYYNVFIDFVRNEKGRKLVEDSFVTAYVDEYIGETEKAIQVRLRSGDCVGSYKGWKTWIPKSVIAKAN